MLGILLPRVRAVVLEFVEGSMPAFNWFRATSILLLLCAAAIAIPFLLAGYPA